MGIEVFVYKSLNKLAHTLHGGLFLIQQYVLYINCTRIVKDVHNHTWSFY